jgi:hypothetical protein
MSTPFNFENKMKQKILIIWSGPDSGTSANLFKSLTEVLAEHHKVVIGPNGTILGSRFKKILYHIFCDLRRWPKIVSSDIIILHSYAALSLPSVLLAWALRLEIVIVMWDAYPITLDGKPLDGLFRKAMNRLENFIISLSTRLIIPSMDFAPFVKHTDVRVLPLWPSVPLGRVAKRTHHQSGQPIRLAFVGQAVLTRGLPHAIARLGEHSQVQFELHIFSPRPPEGDVHAIAPNVRVVVRNYLPREDLIAALDQMDFGLISLHPGMGQPGFPSKVFDCVAAGLPVLYTGRALPAFEALLERTGVGFVLTNEYVDWEATAQASRSAMPEAVKAFLEETELTFEKLERAIF